MNKKVAIFISFSLFVYSRSPVAQRQKSLAKVIMSQTIKKKR